ncbi:MAG: EamA family transporter [Candidatus Micrarchaeota archaeon]
MAEWYYYALLTMVFFSISNIALKSLLSEDLMGIIGKNLNSVIPAIIMVAVSIIAAYFLFLSKIPLPQNTLPIAGAFIVLAMTGFVFLMIAVSSGKIALVTAIVSTSSVMVAILSVAILKDSLSPREMAGIVLAFFGVLVLAFK